MSRAVALAAPHPAAVAAGQAAVDGGGNALDAALAAAAALTVVYPHQCALGGDLIALVSSSPDTAPRAVISAGALPAATDFAGLAVRGVPRRGPDAVTVPGVVAGWMALAGLGARLPLAEAIGRAARLAQSAPPVAAGLARAIAAERDAVTADPGLAAVFAPGGRPLQEGDALHQPALAATLHTLSAAPGAFYTHPERLVAGLRALGGRHTGADFAAHRAEVTAALGADIAGTQWWVAPPPSQGAALLGLLPTALAADGDPGPLIAAARTALAVRDRELGDPRTGPVDTAAMATLTDTGRPQAPVTGRALGDTVAVTAVDDTGLAVSLIQSVFYTFGAGVLEPSTGIVLHNRGAAFTVSGPGRAVPGARPPHTLCPLIARAPQLTAAIGCQGGRAQAWILAQTAPGLLRPDSGRAAVLARPRWVIGAADLGFDEVSLLAEPGADAAVAAAAGMGLPWQLRSSPQDEAGHVQAAVLDGHTLDAASDPRADGSGAVLIAGGTR